MKSILIALFLFFATSTLVHAGWEYKKDEFGNKELWHVEFWDEDSGDFSIDVNCYEGKKSVEFWVHGATDKLRSVDAVGLGFNELSTNAYERLASALERFENVSSRTNVSEDSVNVSEDSVSALARFVEPFKNVSPHTDAFEASAPIPSEWHEFANISPEWFKFAPAPSKWLEVVHYDGDVWDSLETAKEEDFSEIVSEMKRHKTMVVYLPQAQPLAIDLKGFAEEYVKFPNECFSTN